MRRVARAAGLGQLPTPRLGRPRRRVATAAVPPLLVGEAVAARQVAVARLRPPLPTAAPQVRTEALVVVVARPVALVLLRRRVAPAMKVVVTRRQRALPSRQHGSARSGGVRSADGRPTTGTGPSRCCQGLWGCTLATGSRGCTDPCCRRTLIPRSRQRCCHPRQAEPTTQPASVPSTRRWSSTPAPTVGVATAATGSWGRWWTRCARWWPCAARRVVAQPSHRRRRARAAAA